MTSYYNSQHNYSAIRKASRAAVAGPTRTLELWMLILSQVEASSYGNTKTFVLNATKEVILSAGAFQSPQLLMVSGIGPRDQLQAHNISVVADRPGVGTY